MDRGFLEREYVPVRGVGGKREEKKRKKGRHEGRDDERENFPAERDWSTRRYGSNATTTTTTKNGRERKTPENGRTKDTGEKE